jgi:hypothetical protein
MVKTTSLSSAAINALTTGDSSILYNNQSRDLVLYSGSLGFSQSGVFNLEINNINGECLKLKYNSSSTNYVDFNLTSTGQLNIIPNGTDKIVNIYHHNGSTSGLSLGGTLITASANELNKLDGVTATTTELNYVDTTQGIAEASKALIVDVNRDISNIRNLQTENLTVNGTLVTSSATELNYNDIATIGTAEPGKALVVDVNRDISNIRNVELTNNLTITNHNGINKGLILGNELVSATASEINKLSGVTATTTELNYVDTTPGTVEASKAIIVDANRDITNIRNLQTENLTVNGTLITASASELNYNDLATIGTAEAGKALVVDVNRDISNIRNLTATNLTGSIQTSNQPNITSVGTLTELSSNGNVNIAQHNGSTTGLQLNGSLVTATANEINVLDGITSTTEELNILDGVTANANEINVLDGITAATAELNILDGVTATYTELNVLDGITATTAELNYVDTTPGTAEASKALILDANRDITNIRNISTANIALNNSTNYRTTIDCGQTYGDRIIGVYNNSTTFYGFGASSSLLRIMGGTTTGIAFYTSASNSSVGTEQMRISSTITSILQTTTSSSSTTGALVVTGGVGIGGALNVSGITRTSILQVGTSTDTTRLISALDGITTAGSVRVLTLGSSNSPGNQAEFSFNYQGSNSNNNRLNIGFHSNSQILNIFRSGNVGINTTAPDRNLEINASDGNCLRLTYNDNNGSAANYTDFTLASNGNLTINSSGGTINLSNSTASTSTTTGSLVVTGGVGIGGATYIGGGLSVTGNITGTLTTSNQSNITTVGTLTGLTSSGIVSITNTTLSNNTNTGALVILGGVGIGNNLNIGGTLSVTGNITGTLATANQSNITTVGILTGLTTSGIVSITNTTDSTTSNNGALVISGGVGITGAINTINSISTTQSVGDGFVHNATGTNTITLKSYINTANTWAQFGTTTNHELRLMTNSISRLNISNSGNILIINTTASTTSSNGALVVTGGVGIGGNLNTSGIVYGGRLEIPSSNWGLTHRSSNSSVEIVTYSNGSNNNYIGTYTSHDFGLATNELNRLIVKTDGKIGINTTVPSSQLEINASDGNCLRLTYNDSDGSALNYTDLTLASNGDLSINSSGGTINLTNSTATTSKTTGSLVVTGGIGISGNMFCNGLTIDAGTSANIVAKGSNSSLRMLAHTDNVCYIQAGNADGTAGSSNDIFIGDYGQTTITSARKFIIKGGTGNVGIGNAAPNYPLDVIGIAHADKLLIGTSTDTTRLISALDGITTAGSVRVLTLGSSSSPGNQAEFSFNYQGSNSNNNRLNIGFHSNSQILNILRSSRVGINTTAPDRNLEINASDGNCLRLSYNDNNGSATNYTDFTLASNGNLTINSSGGTINLSNSTASTSTTTGALVVTGGIGIGGTLNINGGIIAIGQITANGKILTNGCEVHTGINWSGSGANGYGLHHSAYGDDSVLYRLVSTGYVDFPGDAYHHKFGAVGNTTLELMTNNTSRMLITSDGNICTYKGFAVNRDSFPTTYASSITQFYVEGNISTDWIAIFKANTTSTGRAITFRKSDNTEIGSISFNASSVTYNTTSDYRLKKDIEPLDGLNIIMKLNPIKFKWKSDNSYGDGFIAHELQEHYPSAVIGEKDALDPEGNPDYQCVSYSNLVGLAISGIKQQQELIINLNQKNNELENNITSLENENKLLKDQIQEILSRLTNLEN